MTDPLQLRIEATLEGCGIERWERVTRESPLFMRAPFLQALEDSMPDSLQPRYGIVGETDNPVAVMVGQVVTIQADKMEPAAAGKARPKLVRSVMSRLRTRVFQWGNFMGWGHSGIAFAPGADREALWPGLAAAMDSACDLDAEIRAAGIELVLDLSDDETRGARHLEAYRFCAMRAEPDMVLALDPAWKGFEDYRAALKSKYRKASLDMDKELSAAGCVIEKLEDVEAHADALLELHLQVHEQSVNRFVTLKRAFLPGLAHRLGDRFICRIVRQGPRILGFVTTLIDGETALAYVVGHDVEANRALPIYLRLLQTAIDDGIRHGCRRVTYGRTALEPKARLGAVARPLTIYGRHRNPVIGPLVTPILQQLAPTEGPPPRSPFKE